MDVYKIRIDMKILRSRPNLFWKTQTRSELLPGHSLGDGQCPVFLGDFAGGMAVRCAWHAGVPQARLGRLVGKLLWLGTKGAAC